MKSLIQDRYCYSILKTLSFTKRFFFVTEREIVESRLDEKAKLENASKHMTKLFIATSSLIFMTLIVVWLMHSLPEIVVPSVYKFSTWFIIFSSVLVIMSQIKIREDEIEKAFRFTAFGLVFGLIFSVLQVVGWQELLGSNDSFRNILFPFSLVHFVHIGVGIALLLSVFVKIREYKVHSKSRQYAYNVFMFWHFLGAVWVFFILLA